MQANNGILPHRHQSFLCFANHAHTKCQPVKHLGRDRTLLPRTPAVQHHVHNTVHTGSSHQLAQNRSIRRSVSSRNAVAGGDGATTKSYSPRTTPSDRVLAIWRKADAVCFDVDCETCSRHNIGLCKRDNSIDLPHVPNSH